MSSLRPPLKTVKPETHDPVSPYHVADVGQQGNRSAESLNQQSVDTHNRPSASTRRRKSNRSRRQRSDFEIHLSESSISLATMIKRFASGWMVSLILHGLLMAWLATFITVLSSNGPLTLTVSMVDDEASDAITIEISPMDFDGNESESENSPALQLDESPIDPIEILDTQLIPETEIPPTVSLDIESIFDSQDDASLLEPVNLGIVGLDEGDGTSDSKSKGRSAKVQFFGLESSGDRFIFVVDCSGSMGDELRYQRAIYELSKSMEMLKTNHKFLVILYNTETKPMLGMTDRNIRLISATTGNKRRVVDWLKRQTPSSQTMPMVAMRTSLTLDPSSIYFLSDGEFHDRTIPMLHNLNVDDSSAGRRKIPVNTITLGSTGLGAPMMKHIAEESGGRFLWVQ